MLKEVYTDKDGVRVRIEGCERGRRGVMSVPGDIKG